MENKYLAITIATVVLILIIVIGSIVLWYSSGEKKGDELTDKERAEIDSLVASINRT